MSSRFVPKARSTPSDKERVSVWACTTTKQALHNTGVAGFVGRNQVFLHQYTGQTSGEVSKLIPEFYSLLRTMNRYSHS